MPAKAVERLRLEAAHRRDEGRPWARRGGREGRGLRRSGAANPLIAGHDEQPMDLFAAEQAMMRAQLVAVESLARDQAGDVVHPQLLRRYTARANVDADFSGTDEDRADAIRSHFDVILGAVEAGRAELVRLHRTNHIDDETMRDLEHDLVLEEMGAVASKV